MMMMMAVLLVGYADDYHGASCGANRVVFS